MTGRPAESLAFLLHSLYGMDHYPAYLLKWDADRLQQLRAALVQQIAKVDAAVSLLQQRALTQPPPASRVTQQDVLSWINPLILEACGAPRDRLLPLFMSAAVDELGDGSVWTFRLLSDDGDLQRNRFYSSHF
jgi:hypothetical protein